jgi:class 3 adenylate cyclase
VISAPALRSSSSAQPPFQLSDEIPANEVIDDERKTVTALFADIKGSTELMEDLDLFHRTAAGQSVRRAGDRGDFSVAAE